MDGVLKKRSITSNSPKGLKEECMTHFMALETEMLERTRINNLLSLKKQKTKQISEFVDE